MMRLTQYAIIGVLFGNYIACAPVRFDKDPSVNKCQNFMESCIATSGNDEFDYTVTAAGGIVDILIVNDNSGSMSFEQSQMARKFSDFLNALDVKNVDYRIGIITTDVSNSEISSSTYNPARQINENGALQDGNLVQFKDSTLNASYPYLDQSTPNREELFAATIQRSETARCERFIRDNADTMAATREGDSAYAAGINENCPSGDERGIKAANLFLQKNPSSFLRPKAHLAIVFLSDEDERSSAYSQSSGYKLDSGDLPQSLIDRTKQLYGSKSLSIHSIIVRPGELKSEISVELALNKISQGVIGDLDCKKMDGGDPRCFFSASDTSCLSSQNNQLNVSTDRPGRRVSGSYGYLYYLASKLTDGIVGNICANDYSSQLRDMGVSISNRLSEIQLACADPQGFSLVMSPDAPDLSYTLNNGTVKFSGLVPAGTKVRIRYSCRTL